jgi:outer membrane protein TolC
MTVLTAFQETEDALLTADRLGEQEKLIGDVVTAANETFTFTKSRYEKGLSSNLEVTIAERDALNAKRSYIQVRFDRLRASANLARVLGGGWNRDTAIDKSVDDYEKHLEEQNKAAEKAKDDAAKAKDEAEAKAKKD